MRAAIFLCTSLLCSAADLFLGDWKLNPQKSSPGIKTGRALIDTSLSGQYLQFSETIFESGDPLRFNGEMRDGGPALDAQLGTRPIRYVSKKNSDGYEISINDP